MKEQEPSTLWHLYADGIRRWRPDAVQAVHRFHLVHNLRQGYGRAGFALLRQRVLQAA
jgi:hypothetical protein